VTIVAGVLKVNEDVVVHEFWSWNGGTPIGRHHHHPNLHITFACNLGIRLVLTLVGDLSSNFVWE